MGRQKKRKQTMIPGISRYLSERYLESYCYEQMGGLEVSPRMFFPKFPYFGNYIKLELTTQTSKRFSNCDCWTSCKNLLKMALFRPHFKITEPETLCIEPCSLCFHTP